MIQERSLRVDVADLKGMMLKKIGPERFKQYFYCLDRFINQKMGKVEFNRACLRVLGKENLPLHNQIIRAILKNACNARAPPPPQVSQVGPRNSATVVRKNSAVVEDGHLHRGFVAQNQMGSAPIHTNGVLPMSPRKVRTGGRDRKLRDRPSPLGPNGKTDSASHQSTATEDSGARIVDDRELMPFDYQRPIQHLQGLAEQPEIDEKLRLNKCSDVPDTILGKKQSNVAIEEEGEEVEQASQLNLSKSPLVAPLGIPFCSASAGGTHKSSPIVSALNFPSSVDSGVLPDSETLRQWMEQIAGACGLTGGVTMECANSLNIMLDVYLKRLIKSCVELVGESSKSDPIKNSIQRQLMQSKLMNGLWPSNHSHMQSASGVMEGQITKHSISVLDFKAAMELKPQQLGEDWPLLMEKISMQAFEE